MKILVLGASGMLGNAMIRVLSEAANLDVFGTIRSDRLKGFFPRDIAARLYSGVNVEDNDLLQQAFLYIRPDVVINCVGLVKQLTEADDPLRTIPLNSLLPHRLARLCALTRTRLIHVSTDCVFAGTRGMYRETDPADAEDLYGRSKYLGEVSYPHTITLRTSIIGHELSGEHGLVGWFLSQEKSCRGYRRAIFSGLPTVALAQLIRDIILPLPELSGVFHVAAQPITKYDLLHLVAKVYNKTIEIIPDDQLTIDRSLNATLFEKRTGYIAPSWPELIQLMHTYR